MHRLLHPPPIDPRAPVGVRLLDRYVPGHRALIVLPVDPDLGVEILMRGGRTNSMFIGDPVDDSLVPSLWMQQAHAPRSPGLRAGQRLLIDEGTLLVLRGLCAPTRTSIRRRTRSTAATCSSSGCSSRSIVASRSSRSPEPGTG